MLSIFGIAFAGLVSGAIARFVLPGRQNMGWIMTAILGMAGSLLANKVGTTLGFYRDGDTASWFGSVAGAVILLIVYSLVKSSMDTKNAANQTSNDNSDANQA
jgi:uncharacterized membrane protein YeaQ/YmgE (transglycosylase-associated protein family)